MVQAQQARGTNSCVILWKKQYVYIYKHIYIYIYLYIYKHIYIYINIYIYLDIALCPLGHIERSTGRAIAAYALCARSLLAV